MNAGDQKKENRKQSGIGLEIDRNTSDVMKGLSIILVVLTHLPIDLPVLSLRGLGGLGVGTFLFLSGFGLERSCLSNGNKGYWGKRITKTYLPFLIAMAIQFLVKLLLHETQIRLKVIPSFLGLDAHNIIDPSMWYITYAFLYYAAFFFSTLLGKSLGVKTLALLICAVVIQCVTAAPMFDDTGANLFFLSFVLGVVFADLKRSDLILPFPLCVLLVFAFPIIWFGSDFVGIPYYFTSAFYAVAPFFILFLSKLIVKSGIFRAFAYLGKKSYFIYLCEYLCVSISFSSVPAFLRARYQTDVPPGLSILLLIALIVLFSFVFDGLNKLQMLLLSRFGRRGEARGRI